jgi:DNA-binding NarL/FixJ family response regulator
MARDAQPIEVLIAEDNRDLCAALRAVIMTQPDMSVIGTVGRVAELLELVATTTARVLIVDLDLAGESSLPALRAFRAAHPRRAIVVHSGHDLVALGPALAGAGSCEYVTKSGDAQELFDAIRRGAAYAADQVDDDREDGGR